MSLRFERTEIQSRVMVRNITNGICGYNVQKKDHIYNVCRYDNIDDDFKRFFFVSFFLFLLEEMM